MWEPIDSSFVDVTLLSHLNDMAMTNGFYVGVFNRRTNPMMAIPSTDSLAFHTYDELLTEWNRNPGRLYAQVGAREIRLPFRVPSGPNGYRTLHVTELGASDANAGGNRPLMRVALDTMIGQDGDLNITLLPGEGRIYRVQYVDAEQQIARGWLEHNTQRKMVVHPDVAMRQPPLPPGPIIENSPVEIRPACINADGSGVTRIIQRVRDGDQWRYHMVYHRRLTPPASGEGADTGPLSVFYRRSAPLTNPEADGPGDELEDGAITWEPEILINDHFQPLADPPSVPSCGYPSIVVRYDATRQQNMVYIVYACETAETLPNQNILIAEAQFPADIANQDAWYHSPMQGSYVLDLVRSSGENNNSRLHHWGTPVINASYDGNYYAWSVYGFKLPQQRQFSPGGMNQVKAFAERGGIAYVSKYPSMHSYSRIKAGEVDASLVWQEGPNVNDGIGRSIMYTRLRRDAQTNASQHHLSVFGPPPIMMFTHLVPTGATQAAQIVDQNRVFVLSNRDVGTHGTNERPTLLRLLSDFPDESMLATSPVFDHGHLNHKPDRVVWESTYHEPGGNQTPRLSTNLAHRVVDLLDHCPEGSNLGVTSVWSTPEALIESRNFDDLTLPELAHGEMKTELHVNPLTHPQFVPASWDYDDSVMVLGFASVPMGGRHGSLYQMTYGHDLYGLGMDQMLHTAAINMRANIRRLREGGRSPHTAARHNVVHAQRIFKGRRIYENADPLEQPNLWARAPQMTRTNQGFFKTNDASRTGHVPTRAWQGFAGADGHAMVTDLALNGTPLGLTRVNDDKIMQPRKAGPQQLVSEWLSIDNVSALDMERRSSAAEDRVTVYFERERDGARMPFAYFNGRQKKRWQLIPDPQERYRVVIENTGADLGFVTDLELMDGETSLQRDVADAIQLIDLRRIGTALVTMGEQALEVWPQPASDLLNIITQVGQTSLQGTITIRDVRGTVMLQVPCKPIDLFHIPTIGMQSGTYSASLEVDGRTLGRILVIIVR